MKPSEMLKIVDDFLYIRFSITGKEALKLSQQLLVEIEEAEYEWENEDGCNGSL